MAEIVIGEGYERKNNLGLHIRNKYLNRFYIASSICEVGSMVDIDRDANQIDQRKMLLDSIFSHKMDFVKSYFRDKDVPFSYRRDLLYSKLNEGIDDGTFSLVELTELLDRIEEFGNQHIYLFKCNPEYVKILRNPSYMQEKLNNLGLSRLYNNENFVILPNESILSGIIHNDNSLKFKWIEKRVWKEPLEEKIEDDKFIKTYQIKLSRGITTFRVNLVSGNAELMIQRLPRGTNYENIKNNYLDRLANLFEIHSLTPLGLRRSIRRLEESNEVSKRQIDLESIDGGRVAYKSRDKKSDYKSDPNLSRSRNALGQNVSGNTGSFYWKNNNILSRPILTHVYAKDNRLGIFGQCVEAEVNYVLSRIRYFASE